VAETTTTLRLLRAHLEAASALIDGLMPPDQRPAGPDEPEEVQVTCPHCNEKRESKLEDSTAPDEGGRLIPRVTCLSCGKSFNPKAEEVIHG
jgi:DNA-directed RNA polymerase subunit RPC12/RpoP